MARPEGSSFPCAAMSAWHFSRSCTPATLWIMFPIPIASTHWGRQRKYCAYTYVIGWIEEVCILLGCTVFHENVALGYFVVVYLPVHFNFRTNYDTMRYAGMELDYLEIGQNIRKL